MANIKRVWIEEGCISCNLCQDICPEVFEVPDGEDCIIKLEAPGHFVNSAEAIREAACDCPVEVIQFADSAENRAESNISPGSPAEVPPQRR